MQAMNNPYFKDLPYQEISKKLAYNGRSRILKRRQNDL